MGKQRPKGWGVSQGKGERTEGERDCSRQRNQHGQKHDETRECYLGTQSSGGRMIGEKENKACRGPDVTTLWTELRTVGFILRAKEIWVPKMGKEPKLYQLDVILTHWLRKKARYSCMLPITSTHIHREVMIATKDWLFARNSMTFYIYENI